MSICSHMVIITQFVLMQLVFVRVCRGFSGHIGARVAASADPWVCAFAYVEMCTPTPTLAQ